MSKMKKPEQSQNTQEPSMPATENQNSTEDASKSSGTESQERLASQLKCPACGADHTHFKCDNTGHVWCGGCGVNASWANTSKKWAPILKDWLEVFGPKPKNMPANTPTCNHHAVTKDGIEIPCGASNWKHDGHKLTYCGTCGSNYTGAQPANVAEIIKALGSANGIPHGTQRKFSQADADAVARASRE